MRALSGGEARHAISPAVQGSLMSRSSGEHLKKRRDCSFTCKQAVGTKQPLHAHDMACHDERNLRDVRRGVSPANVMAGLS